MSYEIFRQLDPGDYTITPFVVNKTWSVTKETTASLGIEVSEGQYTASSVPFVNGDTNSDDTYVRSIYDTVNKMYYGRWISASGEYITSSIYDTFGDHYNTTRSIEDRLQFISIPTEIIGERIKPHSFILTGESATITDDGYGNLVSESVHVGNIFYEHGNIIITKNTDSCQGAAYGSGYSMVFDSTVRMVEHQAVCYVPENSLTMTMNPTMYISSSDSSIHGQPLTASLYSDNWSPYITTIGLYNDKYELVMVGKLAQPIKNDPELALAFTVQIDI